MNSEFMRRLALQVVNLLPVIDGETFNQYNARGLLEPIHTRIALASALGVVSKQMAAERQAVKKAWIASARLGFSPGLRQSCAVCGKYKSLTEAHHVVPLGLQFEAGATDPIQEYRWLCPTHHAAEHVIIAALIKTIQPDLEGMPAEERDALSFGGGTARFVDLFYKLPFAHSLSKSYREAEAFLRGSDE